MSVDLFGIGVRAETAGNMVSLTDLIRAGNYWRTVNHLPLLPVRQILDSKAFKQYQAAAAEVWRVDSGSMVKIVGRGASTRTMGHIAVAVYVAEQMSPVFHANVIKTFVEGKLLEFRDMGGTEFKNLNAAIDLYLPGRDGKDNKGVYIQIAMRLRARLLGPDAGSEAWGSATVAQTHARYSSEAYLVRALGDGLVRDYEHLKELVARV